MAWTFFTFHSLASLLLNRDLGYSPSSRNSKFEIVNQEASMKKLFVSLAFVAMGILPTSVLSAQSEYYVQSIKAKVMSGPSFKSGIISEVSRGYKFISSGRDGSWVKVRIFNKNGYVSSLLVSTHPPFEKKRVIRGDEADIEQGVRRRASSYTSAAAARGLAQDDRRRLSKEEKIDYESLEKMEAFTLSSDEVTRFMEGEQQ
jgi:hypothetical protein